MIIPIKSKEEVEKFIEAGKITAEIMEIVKYYLEKDGGYYCTGNEIDTIIRDECKMRGIIPAFLNYKGFPASCCFSVNNILVHGIPNDTPLKDGDVVSVDIGIDIDGFYGDHAITVGIGEDNDHYEIIETCEDSLSEVISNIGPGDMFSKIPKIIQESSGKFKTINDYGGHGVSRGILHDNPFVPNVDKFIYDDFSLRENMIFAIEPMLTYGDNNTKIKEDGWTVYTDEVSVHFEHMILITKEGTKVLTEV